MTQIDLTPAQERERAYEYFRAVLAVHTAAIHAFKLVPALPDVTDLLATNVRLRKGLDTVSADSAIHHAVAMRETMEAEKGRNFEVIRGSALIAVCGAFEYLLKATFVDQALSDPKAAATLLSAAKHKISLTDFLGTTPIEQWYLIAESLLVSFTERSRLLQAERWLMEYIHLPDRDMLIPRFQKVFNELDRSKFDEAFLIRSCLVHNGGRVDRSLALQTRRVQGARIGLGDGTLGPLLAPLQTLADQLDLLWLGVL